MDGAFPYYTVAEAAVAVDESAGTIRSRIRAGVIAAVPSRFGLLIRTEDLDDYLKRRGPKQGRGFFRNAALIPRESTGSGRQA
ncbi:helix-turn-helix domain-containing protein [Streptomyces iranensis]|uniref:helix-turn-helix domain-containing protein n=1 Tax=Streptomyces iranensis TaxID=576784 RepID=UPI0039B78D9F